MNGPSGNNAIPSHQLQEISMIKNQKAFCGGCTSLRDWCLVGGSLLASALFAGCITDNSTPGVSSARLVYPVTRKTNTVDDYHGVKVADPYRWLEDDNAAETKAWVEAENKVTFGYLEKIPERN